MNTPKPTSYPSSQLRCLANRAFHRSVSSSDESEVTIILAAISIEAFLNDLAHFATFVDDSPAIVAMGQMLTIAEDNHAQPKLKLHIVHFALTGQPLKNDSTVAQDFDALMGLRNGLAHAKPLSFDWDFHEGFSVKPIKEYPKPIRHLINSNVIEIPEIPLTTDPVDIVTAPTTWRKLVADARVARWSYNAVITIMREVSTWIPPGTLRELITGLTNELELVPPTRPNDAT